MGTKEFMGTIVDKTKNFFSKPSKKQNGNQGESGYASQFPPDRDFNKRPAQPTREPVDASKEASKNSQQHGGGQK